MKHFFYFTAVNKFYFFYKESIFFRNILKEDFYF